MAFPNPPLTALSVCSALLLFCWTPHAAARPDASPTSPEACGHVNLFTQAAVDAFDCTSVLSLTLGGGQIQNLDGFSELTTIEDDLYVDGLPALTSIAGLSQLSSVGRDVYIGNNGVLASLSGLDQLATVGGDFYIYENGPSLTSLDGLSSLTTIGNDLYVDSNPGLTSIASLSTLRQVGNSLIVSGNPTLGACAPGLSGLIGGDPPAFTGVGGGVGISRNAPGCASVQEVLDAFGDLNAPPAARAGADRSVVVGQTVSLDGTASSDPDEDPLTFAWTLTGAPLSGADTATPSFCAAEAGTYTASLVVNDGTTDSAADAVVVTAVAPGAAATALQGDVGTLEADGVLSPSEAWQLNHRLDKAARQLARGDADKAAKELEKFDRRVGALVDRGELDAEVGATLTASTGAIAGAATTPCTAAAAAPMASVTLPTDLALGAAFPNPATGSATVPFDLPEATSVTITVYDLLGRQMTTLADGPFEAGSHTTRLDAGALATGTYLVRLETATGEARTGRITVVR